MSSPISGFTAIPNPQMLAFMPIQSYLMMYFAGAGWQIGKRKISAIPNDQFNKMSANDLLQGFTADLKGSIPTLERSLQDISPLIKVLIEQYGDFVREALAAVPQAITNIFSGGVSSDGGREVIQRTPTAGLSKGTQAAFLGYAEQQLMQQYILDQQARAGSTQNIRDVSTVLNPLQRAAIRKQEEFEKAQILARQMSVPGRIAFTKTRQPVSQVRAGTFKKTAGQSQKMERLSLIRNIAKNTKLLKEGGVGGKTLAVYAMRIRNDQQRLVNLFARYRF